MPLFSKNGSIPKPQPDGTDGWVLVPEMPACPDGKEVVWLNWEWIIRDPKPADRAGWQWNWNHADRAWVESAWGTVEVIEPIEPIDLPTLLTTDQVTMFTTSQIA